MLWPHFLQLQILFYLLLPVFKEPVFVCWFDLWSSSRHRVFFLVFSVSSKYFFPEMSFGAHPSLKRRTLGSPVALPVHGLGTRAKKRCRVAFSCSFSTVWTADPPHSTLHPAEEFFGALASWYRQAISTWPHRGEARGITGLFKIVRSKYDQIWFLISLLSKRFGWHF